MNKEVVAKRLTNCFNLVKNGQFSLATYELSKMGVSKRDTPKSWNRFWRNANRCIENSWDAQKFVEIMLNKYNVFTEEAYSSFLNEVGDKIPAGTTLKYQGERFSKENCEYIIAELEYSKRGRSQGVAAWDNLEFRAYHKIKKMGLNIPDELQAEVHEFYSQIYGDFHTPSKEERTRFEQAAFEYEVMPQLPLDEVNVSDSLIDLRGGYKQGKKIAGRILLAETATMKGLLAYITSPDKEVQYFWERFKASAVRAVNMCPDLISNEDYLALREIFNLIKQGKEEWLQKGFEETMVWAFPPAVEEVDEEDLLF